MPQITRREAIARARPAPGFGRAAPGPQRAATADRAGAAKRAA
jgi:hypothetical protein